MICFEGGRDVTSISICSSIFRHSLMQEMFVCMQLTFPPRFLIAELLKYDRVLLSENCVLTTMSRVQTPQKYARGIFKMFSKSLHIRYTQNSLIIKATFPLNTQFCQLL